MPREQGGGGGGGGRSEAIMRSALNGELSRVMI